MKLRLDVLAVSVLAVLSLSACGGGSMGSAKDPSSASTVTYTIGGTISGLTGSGLVLQDNGGNNLAVSANQASFAFSTAIHSGSTYNVTVLTPPSNPAQTCTVANGNGTANANVTNTVVTCTTTTYTIGGTISGLTGTGLVLQDNGGDNLAVSANQPSFSFSTPIPSGSTYGVTVSAQPSGQTCTVSNGNGTATGNVVVAVTCSATQYTISAAVSGLTGTLVLQDNPGNTMTVTTNATLGFSPQIPSGGAYAVAVVTQPAGQTCAVSNGSGTATGNVTVAVTCSATQYTISAAVSGLTGTLVLQDNPGNTMTVTTNATFGFSPQIPSGGAYAVVVVTQPAGQICTVSNGSGAATGNVTVAVTCSATQYTISAAVSGLTGTLVLQDNPGNTMTVTTNATLGFSPQIPSGGAYMVAIVTQPAGQTCTVSNGSGTATGNVTVGVTCTATLYTISATVSGLTGTLVLQDNPGNTMTVTTNATFGFSPQIPSGGAYAVVVVTQPAGQTCAVSNGSGTATGNVTVAVTCSATQYTISAAVSGLTGTLVLQDNPGNTMTVTTNATFGFSPQIPSGGAYAVVVVTQPAGQTCTVSNGSGTATGNVTVAVTCSAITYTVGGTVSGLAGTGLVLQNKGTNLTIPAGATSFSFTGIPSGSAYSVTVVTQPSNPAQTCTVTNGSGTANANVTNVLVGCSNEWTWINGAKVGDQNGVYGTKKVAAPGNVAGGRYSAVTWTDASGNFWLFGGFGDDLIATENYLNDLWKYSGGEWTWMGGSNFADQIGTYGTMGTASGNNIPGARTGAVGWKDSAGNFWLFGGYGDDSNVNDAPGPLNDLWKYSGGQWTWMGGSDLTNQQGTYGTQGTAASGNLPGARYWASASTDASGNFWLFGGYGLDSQGTEGSLNDLWEFNTSTNEWTWISGSNTQGQSPTYGTMGQGATGNVPGARYGTANWMDSSGDFWFFGGLGIDSNNAFGYLNDLWEYIPSSGEWAWLGGASVANQPGTYGTEGVAAPGNVPGGRMWPAGWSDSSGNFWLFGGQQIRGEALNDLWSYSAGQWTWMSGSDTPNQEGTYGTQGTPAATNLPGARWLSASWIDATGNLWLFGGDGIDSTDNFGVLNDLWQYAP